MGLKDSWPPGSAYSPFFIPPSPHESLGAKQRLYWQSSENASKQVPTQKAEYQSEWETVQAQTCSRGLEPSPDTPTLAQAAVSHVVRVPVRRTLGTSSPAARPSLGARCTDVCRWDVGNRTEPGLAHLAPDSCKIAAARKE